MKNIFIIIFIFTFFNSFSQDKSREIKALKATRTLKPPKIDGDLNDQVWYTSKIANEFVMYEPGDNDPEPDNQKTEVKILYDDEAIYIAGYMYDSNPENILRQLTDRDNFGTADAFGITINPNNDEQNEFMFLVTAAGVQIDAQVSPSNGDDFSWNEVWFSNISFDEKGWYVEIKLPYSALRFSKQEVSTWGINLFRGIEAKREVYSWNPIDKSKGTTSQYTGILTDLENIKPPIRLSFSPFATFIVDDYGGDTNTNFAFGLDLKYGITDNFTLFVTLVPDFSQVGYDNITLNLGPFEQVFAEQRQFFIEGADLLNKGDLFFSRRIGNRPVGHGDVDDFVNENENLEIIDNPTEVDVLNAVKVTGRSKKGLGLAFLNAITEKTEATIKNTLTDSVSKVVTEPLANYNVIVIDQEFNKNSSIGFVNTNVLREGSFRDANVSSLLFTLATKANSYKLMGDASSSTVREDFENTTGFASDLRFSKIKGNVRFDVSHQFADTKYDKNDLGYQRRNNYNNITGNVNYRIFKPTKLFNSFSTGIWAGYFTLFDPSVYTGNHFNLFARATTKKQLSFGGNINFNIGKQKDYFEPRVEGRFWLENPETSIRAWYSSDYRKKFAYEIQIRAGMYFGNDQYDYNLDFSPVYRVNDKLQFRYSFDFEKDINELGFTTILDDGTIIFGKRETSEIENSFSTKYSFNDRSSILLAFRHYWSPVIYQDQYYKLEENGELIESPYTGDNDINFNSWNFDLRYVWEFARGSELVALYRNSILNFEEGISSDQGFQDNITNLFDQPFGHTFSLKVIFHLDYERSKSWVKNKF